MTAEKSTGCIKDLGDMCVKRKVGKTTGPPGRRICAGLARRQIAIWLVAALLLLCSGTLAAIAAMRAMGLPPSDGQSLAAIVQSVERKDLGAIGSIEYERDWWRVGGSWEFTVCREGCFKLYIDPRTGEEGRRELDESKRELPPANTQSPSAIAKSFENGRFGFITEIEFEQGAWQVEFREARGLYGALQPTKRRVFEPTPIPMSRERRVPRSAPPMIRVSAPAGQDPSG